MNIMTKRGTHDNVVTFEHFCDAKADMANIPKSQISLGSTCIVVNEQGSMEVYIADSKKQWHPLAIAGGESSGDGAGLIQTHICSQNEVDQNGFPDPSEPVEGILYFVANGDDGFNEFIYLGEEEGWEMIGSAGSISAAQSDWEQDDDEAVDYINNRPMVFQGEAETAVQEAYGNAQGEYSHAEGFINSESNDEYYDEDQDTTYSPGAYGEASHAEGTNTFAIGDNSHSEGARSVAFGAGSHAENNAKAIGDNSHAENTGEAKGIDSHAEGASISEGVCSHAEGSEVIATGYAAHAEGGGLLGETGGNEYIENSVRYVGGAHGDYSHSEGYDTIAIGQHAHSEGYKTVAAGETSHAEGIETYATGIASHAEGYNTTANGGYQHVSGVGNIIDDGTGVQEWIPNKQYATGDRVKITDQNTNTVRFYYCYTPNNDSNFTSAKWREDNRRDYIEIVGNGVISPSNARTLDWEGNERLAGDLYVHCTSGGAGIKVPVTKADILDTLGITSAQWDAIVNLLSAEEGTYLEPDFGGD